MFCRVTWNGLQAGKFYRVLSVLRSQTSKGIQTTVTVITDDLQRIEVCPAERVLRRTRLEVWVKVPDLRDERYVFADMVELEEWCERNHVEAERVHRFRYLEMR